MMKESLKVIERVDIYVDDIIMYDDTWKDHIKKMRKLFDGLKTANLMIKLAKNEFY